MNPEVDKNLKVGVNFDSQPKEKRKISKPRLALAVSIPLALIALLVIFVFVPLISRASKESAYRHALETRENGELMSIRLMDMIELHYEKGNYESVRRYIEEAAALYSDGYDKIEALSDVNVVFYDAGDWSSLHQFYDYVYKIAKESQVDQEAVNLYRELAAEARGHVEK